MEPAISVAYKLHCEGFSDESSDDGKSVLDDDYYRNCPSPYPVEEIQTQLVIIENNNNKSISDQKRTKMTGTEVNEEHEYIILTKNQQQSFLKAVKHFIESNEDCKSDNLQSTLKTFIWQNQKSDILKSKTVVLFTSSEMHLFFNEYLEMFKKALEGKKCINKKNERKLKSMVQSISKKRPNIYCTLFFKTALQYLEADGRLICPNLTSVLNVDLILDKIDAAAKFHLYSAVNLESQQIDFIKGLISSYEKGNEAAKRKRFLPDQYWNIMWIWLNFYLENYEKTVSKEQISKPVSSTELGNREMIPSPSQKYLNIVQPQDFNHFLCLYNVYSQKTGYIVKLGTELPDELDRLLTLHFLGMLQRSIWIINRVSFSQRYSRELKNFCIKSFIDNILNFTLEYNKSQIMQINKKVTEIISKAKEDDKDTPNCDETGSLLQYQLHEEVFNFYIENGEVPQNDFVIKHENLITDVLNEFIYINKYETSFIDKTSREEIIKMILKFATINVSTQGFTRFTVNQENQINTKLAKCSRETIKASGESKYFHFSKPNENMILNELLECYYKQNINDNHSENMKDIIGSALEDCLKKNFPYLSLTSLNDCKKTLIKHMIDTIFSHIESTFHSILKLNPCKLDHEVSRKVDQLFEKLIESEVLERYTEIVCGQIKSSQKNFWNQQVLNSLTGVAFFLNEEQEELRSELGRFCLKSVKKTYGLLKEEVKMLYLKELHLESLAGLLKNFVVDNYLESSSCDLSENQAEELEMKLKQCIMEGLREKYYSGDLKPILGEVNLNLLGEEHKPKNETNLEENFNCKEMIPEEQVVELEGKLERYFTENYGSGEKGNAENAVKGPNESIYNNTISSATGFSGQGTISNIIIEKKKEDCILN